MYTLTSIYLISIELLFYLIGGVTFEVKILIPKNCQEEAICEFVKKRIGAGQELILSGAIHPTGFSLKVGFKGNIEISEKFAIKEANLMVEVDVNVGVEFSISGVMEVQLKSSTVLLTGKKILSKVLY